MSYCISQILWAASAAFLDIGVSVDKAREESNKDLSL